MSEEKDVQGQAEKEEKGGQGKTSKSNIVLIVIGVIIILALIVIIILLLGGKKEQVVEQPVAAEPTRAIVQGNVLTIDNVEEMFEEKPAVTRGYYRVSMTQEWHFATGDEASYDAYVNNVEDNSHDVYFDLFLGEEEDAEKLIYSSPVIARGAQLKDIKLDESLEAGNYRCLMVYHLVDENQNSVDTLRVIIPIVIEQ